MTCSPGWGSVSAVYRIVVGSASRGMPWTLLSGDAMDPLVDRRAKRLATAAAEENRRSLIRQGLSLTAGVFGLGVLRAGRAKGQEKAFVAESRRRPGRYSRQEGITSWRVRGSGSIYTVKFEHKNRRLSGEARVVYSDGGDSHSFVLTRPGERLQLALNASRGTFAGNDAQGRGTSGVLNKRDVRWEVDAASRGVLEASRTDFRLGSVIAADLTPRWDSRSVAAQQEAPPERVPPKCGNCDGSNLQSAGAIRVFAAASCKTAELFVDGDCARETGCICCSLLPGSDQTGCDCTCIPLINVDCYCVKLGLSCLVGNCPVTVGPA